jgi:hypothetical protein
LLALGSPRPGGRRTIIEESLVRRTQPAVLLVLMLCLLSGCIISVRDGPHDWDDDGDDWRNRQQRNQELIDQLTLGRSLDSIAVDFGEPDFSESFVRNDRQFRALFYRTRLLHEDGRTTRDETTPLVFVGGELVGWGESAMEHALP